jgi:hypothetical protein
LIFDILDVFWNIKRRGCQCPPDWKHGIVSNGISPV